jgi:tetrathionate reductase subunit B
VKQVELTRDDGSPDVMLFSGRCQHCDDAPCVEACPSGASFKRGDGVVLVDDEICSGCELCVPACPYEARWLNPQTNTISKECNPSPAPDWRNSRMEHMVDTSTLSTLR